MGLLPKGKRSNKSSSSKGLSITRFIGPGVTVGGMLAIIGMILTGQVDLSKLDALRSSAAASGTGEPHGASIQPVTLEALGSPSPDTIRIASFNIQAFGKNKAGDPEVMSVLAKIVPQFDVIAIQEVRGGDASPIQSLVDLLRDSGSYYSATISEPIGSGAQPDSYAYLWNEQRIQFVPQSAYLVQDQADRMHREPMVASFESRVGLADGRRPFRFTLINAHTSPSEVTAESIASEMNVLDDVFVRVRQYDYQMTGEEDCIMLGDLNVDTKGLRELAQIPNIESIAGDLKTNTIRSETRDHILIDRTLTREYTGRFGVIDLQRDLNLSEEKSLRVSDHLPLWAEFSAYEMPRFEPTAAQPVAAQPASTPTASGPPAATQRFNPQPAAGQPATAQPFAPQAAAGQSAKALPFIPQSVAGQPSAGQGGATNWRR